MQEPPRDLSDAQLNSLRQHWASSHAALAQRSQADRVEIERLTRLLYEREKLSIRQMRASMEGSGLSLGLVPVSIFRREQAAASLRIKLMELCRQYPSEQYVTALLLRAPTLQHKQTIGGRLCLLALLFCSMERPWAGAWTLFGQQDMAEHTAELKASYSAQHCEAVTFIECTSACLQLICIGAASRV